MCIRERVSTQSTWGSYENTEIMNLLIHHGFPIDQVDKCGKTPLFYASQQDSGIMKDLLIKQGAQQLSGQQISRLPCLLYTSPSPRDKRQARMPSSA
eukprot:TRINITY_DN5010_c0_g1_i1.p2 TRINITY_DN5010_c0_g1~~TRINITY_DN5010_c0_g1_i1.p2  ORF type:complete len:106 (+),score=67.26 TRINITY_DN5010_c0_g1_i1:30-320(+)